MYGGTLLLTMAAREGGGLARTRYKLWEYALRRTVVDDLVEAQEWVWRIERVADRLLRRAERMTFRRWASSSRRRVGLAVAAWGCGLWISVMLARGAETHGDGDARSSTRLLLL
jgi:hypothetical protein